MTPTAIFFAAFLLSGYLCFPLRRALAGWKILDHPVSRSSHTQPTVTAGGLAIILTIGLIGLWWAWGSQTYMVLRMQAAIVVGAAVCLADDRRSVAIPIRLGCQLFMACWGLTILQLDRPLTPIWAWPLEEMWGGLLTVLWLVTYANVFNFMDGVNGLAACQSVVTSLGAALIAVSAGADWVDAPVLSCFLVAGAAGGFLLHNFPKARMFMGDTGSVSLGYILAFVCIWMSVDYGLELLLPLVLLHTNFVLDAAVTLIRRIYRRDHWLEAHREHFYQHLARSGRSHTVVTLGEMGVQLIVVSLMVGYVHAGAALRIILVVLVLCLWVAFFSWSELSFRRALNQSTIAVAVDT